MDGHSADESLLARPLVAATRAIMTFPRLTLGIGLGLAIVCGIYAMGNLGYRTSRLDLLNPKSDYNRLWIEYLDEFGEADDAVVVVEGPSRAHVVPVLEELSKAMADGAKAGKETVVVISADASARHQAVITVMEAARRSGLTQITFATQSTAQAGSK